MKYHKMLHSKFSLPATATDATPGTQVELVLYSNYSFLLFKRKKTKQNVTGHFIN